MSLEHDLALAEWTERRRRYLALGALLAATAAASFLVLSVVNGLEETIGEEISQTLGGDVRISLEHTGLGDGARFEDPRDTIAALRFADPRANFAPRLETQAIFQRGADFIATRPDPEPARAAAVLVGLDAEADARVIDLDDLLVLGRGREAFTHEWRTAAGDRLVPLIVGESFLETGNASVVAATTCVESPASIMICDGAWFDSVYNLSAGLIENNDLVRAKGIVVGAYATGFRMVDRLVVYAPQGEVARLLGHFPSDPPANVILARTSSPNALSERAQEMGLASAPAEEFRRSYLGPVFTSVRVAAWSIVGLLALMTAGWMGYTLAHHVHEDRRKIATFRAVGIPDRVIARTYLLLAGLLAGGAATAGVIATVFISLVADLASRWTGIASPSPSIMEGFALIALSLAAGLTTVRWAFARASRISIREALQAP